LDEGFLRVRCEQCHTEKRVAFSCKKRGFCPSCGGRRMAETAALLADEVLPERPLRQWVLSLPHALRFLLATNSEALTLVLSAVQRLRGGEPHDAVEPVVIPIEPGYRNALIAQISAIISRA
jgi:hypothetical protein